MSPSPPAQVWHEAGVEEEETSAQTQGLVSRWRQKERLKTTAVALVLCLNIGVDPPDVLKISPCARLECWVDPLSMQPPKALETIGALSPTAHDHLRLGHAGACRATMCCMCCDAGTKQRLLLSRGFLGAGKNLQAQYERWQPRAKYKTHLDPTLEDVKKLAVSCRRTAKVR